MTEQPLLIRRIDVERVYGITARQAKRKVESGELSHVHLSGDQGPCWLVRAELDALIVKHTIRKKPKRRTRAS